MIENDSTLQQCMVFISRFVPWQQLRSVKWKNEKPPPKQAYIPTEIEHIANVLTHAVGVLPSIAATLKLWERSHCNAQKLSAIVYGATLVFLFGISTSFHCVFYSIRKGVLKDFLHRCDRAMIYIFIAGSYFPWLTIQHLPDEGWSCSMKWIVWILAILGIIYQQVFHERYKMLETVFYLVMGIFPALPIVTEHYGFDGMIQLKIGGILYVIGIVFFKSDGSIPCAHAIWHVFVILAASVHYFAILHNLYPLKLPLENVEF
ncbi:monocyte to macrophage differentiation factor 2 isoform X1 [Onthophagus taurus]|uniref:monocyte to macrophage differentiation factor 2 isoform X1 n=1 Tax=Onthophagus taurus TaxID=166361 RepID=UPI0039BE6A07